MARNKAMCPAVLHERLLHAFLFVSMKRGRRIGSLTAKTNSTANCGSLKEQNLDMFTKGLEKRARQTARNILGRIIIHQNIVDDYQDIESITKPEKGGRPFLDTHE
jgi:hypothetical protein